MSESSLKKILLGVFDDFLARGAGATASSKAEPIPLVETDGSPSSLLTVSIMFIEASCSDVARFVVALGTCTRLTSFFFFGSGLASCVGSGRAFTGASIVGCSISFSECFLVTFCCLVILASGFLSTSSLSNGSVSVVARVLSFTLDCAVSALSCTCFRTAFFRGTAFFRLFSIMHSSWVCWLNFVFSGGADSDTETVSSAPWSSKGASSVSGWLDVCSETASVLVLFFLGGGRFFTTGSGRDIGWSG